MLKNKINQVLILMAYLLFYSLSSVYAGSTLSAGANHVCGVKEDNTLVCWGDNSQNQVDPPDGTFTEVSAGFNFNCALSTDGSVSCWGEDTSGETSPPPGQFIQVEVGGKHACALKENGSPICWGANDSSQVSYPPGPFQQLTLGDAHSCGLKPDGTVECWGDGESGQANIAADTFKSIVAGYKTTCGIMTDGVAICWGQTNQSYGYLTQIDYGVISFLGRKSNTSNDPIFCGLKTDGSISCPSLETVPSGVFSYVSTGGNSECISDCSRSSISKQWHVFKSFACGIRENGVIACWGENNLERATPPVGVLLKQPSEFTAPSAYASCSNTGIDSTVNDDLSIRINKLRYQNSNLYANFIFAGKNEKGKLTWVLDTFGDNP
ncbi:MAG: hypothetical protein Q9M50_11280 [Methylococcales bacterium]|nr:hypothetical protein [Methylococcales bacterium]